MPSPKPTDLIDAVDAENRVIGTVRRRDAFAQHANFRTVHVFVFRSNGDILLQKISTENKRSSGLWGSSVAGYPHAGELTAEAAERRMREEIGLSAPLKHAGVFPMRDNGVLKFVELYLANADGAIINDGSIEKLWYWKQYELDEAIRKSAHRFTTTFRAIYQAWSERNDT